MKHRGIFVTASGYLANRPGGAQQCTREYIATLRAAGIELHFCSYELDKRLSTRVIRKLWPSGYLRFAEQGLVRRIANMVERTDARFVLLNQVQLTPIAASLRIFLPPNCKIVALSHGLESTDLLHALRWKSDFPLSLPRYPLGASLLGDTLLRESSHRSSLDLILCLSPFDVELERWLGARRVEWLPRTVTPVPLDWAPQGNRIGFVGTLDHPPNIEGLLVLLQNLQAKAPPGVRVRVVGGPERIGRLLDERFPIVDYLGALPDDKLREDASTWNCFAHPIFCYPRGCSTKLAMAIGWQIPVVTTTPGHRGYDWSRGSLSIANSPDTFSNLCLEMMNVEVARRARAEITEVAGSSPTIDSVADKLSLLLEVN
jgi:glycosyltransferase involved in cell wall biosynthesis